LGMARRTERHQAVEIAVLAPCRALDDVVDLETPCRPQAVPPPDPGALTRVVGKIVTRDI
jgi:hypothetical protein